MRKVLSILLLLFLAGCAGKATAPDWLTQKPANYPADRYLSGQGQGETAGIARDRARADLAKVFEVAVRESSSEELQWQQGAGEHDGLKTRISRDISARTSQVVEGIQLVETWQAESGGDYYALAVLDRLTESNRLRSEIRKLDAVSTTNIERARAEETLPEQVAAAYNALQAQVRRIHPQKMSRVVDVTGRGLPPTQSLAKLKNDFEALLDRWKIGVLVEQDEFGGLAELLTGALAGSGVRPMDNVDEADYLLTAELDNERFKTTDGWYWIRGNLHLVLREAGSENTIGSHLWHYKASARQAEMASLRARSQLDEMLNRELLKVLLEFGDVAVAE